MFVWLMCLLFVGWLVVCVCVCVVDCWCCFLFVCVFVDALLITTYFFYTKLIDWTLILKARGSERVSVERHLQMFSFALLITMHFILHEIDWLNLNTQGERIWEGFSRKKFTDTQWRPVVLSTCSVRCCVNEKHGPYPVVWIRTHTAQPNKLCTHRHR